MPFFGVCFGPYFVSGSPPQDVPKEIVDTGVSLIAQQKFTHMRTYSCQGGNKFNVELAKKYGLKVGLGIWVEPGKTGDNHTAIVDGWSQVHQFPDVVVDFVIGNEVDRGDDKSKFAPGEIKDLLGFAKEKRTSTDVRVTSCFSGTVLQHNDPEWGAAVDACETVVYLTVYPWYGGGDPNNIQPNMDWSWLNGLKQVTDRKKTIVIAEIGWPTAGQKEGCKPATPENQKINFETTKKFLLGGTSPHFALDAYWFEMFDEGWKSKEGSFGSHWGLLTGSGSPSYKWTPPPTGR
jgi:exo-beta-1,3-glucanase (GH17 family)